jgi:hypothetical protein
MRCQAAHGARIEGNAEKFAREINRASASERETKALPHTVACALGTGGHRLYIIVSRRETLCSVLHMYAASEHPPNACTLASTHAHKDGKRDGGEGGVQERERDPEKEKVCMLMHQRQRRTDRQADRPRQHHRGSRWRPRSLIKGIRTPAIPNLVPPEMLETQHFCYGNRDWKAN